MDGRRVGLTVLKAAPLLSSFISSNETGPLAAQSRLRSLNAVTVPCLESSYVVLHRNAPWKTGDRNDAAEGRARGERVRVAMGRTTSEESDRAERDEEEASERRNMGRGG